MACSRFEYVKQFERADSLLPATFIVVRVDGRGFSRFTKEHSFETPLDSRGLGLMIHAAGLILADFQDVLLAYGQSDEFSFVFRKDCSLFERRACKIVSTVTSSFTAYYQWLWSVYFPGVPLRFPPSFDGRAVEYPSESHIRDYLAWRQADCHINNLYNQCYWRLLKRNIGSTPKHVYDRLKVTNSAEKNEILFGECGLNYNSLPELNRKGCFLTRAPESASAPPPRGSKRAAEETNFARATHSPGEVEAADEAVDEAAGETSSILRMHPDIFQSATHTATICSFNRTQRIGERAASPALTLAVFTQDIIKDKWWNGQDREALFSKGIASTD